jgi:NTE family protein
VICGTRIGALIGAALVMEAPFETVRGRMHEFSRRHPLWELVIPCSSLLSSRQLRLATEKWFGELAIEDIPVRFACVTSNLTTSNVAAHERGKLKTWVSASSSLPAYSHRYLPMGPSMLTVASSTICQAISSGTWGQDP